MLKLFSLTYVEHGGRILIEDGPGLPNQIIYIWCELWSLVRNVLFRRQNVGWIISVVCISHFRLVKSPALSLKDTNWIQIWMHWKWTDWRWNCNWWVKFFVIPIMKWAGIVDILWWQWEDSNHGTVIIRFTCHLVVMQWHLFQLSALLELRGRSL